MQVCGVTSKLNLNDVNEQTSNFRQVMLEQVQSQAKDVNLILFKCSVHTKKPIEFRCNKCKQILCSLCMLKHSGHSEDVEIFTEDEIVKESYHLIEIN